MAKEYLYKAYGSKLAALNKRRKKKRNTMKKAMLSAAIIITVAAAVILIIAQFGKKSNELVGTWRYDEHTQYVFEKDGTGKLLADDVTYSYAYTVKGKKLILDFTEDIVRAAGVATETSSDQEVSSSEYATKLPNQTVAPRREEVGNEKDI